MKQTARVEQKIATEFGQTVTLYRVVDNESGQGTLWHSNLEKAWGHFARLRLREARA